MSSEPEAAAAELSRSDTSDAASKDKEDPDLGTSENVIAAAAEPSEGLVRRTLGLARAVFVTYPCEALGGLFLNPGQPNFYNSSALVFLLSLFILPEVMTYPLFAVCRLVLGTLYPAYASYKAVRTKNVREYVSIMYNIIL